MRKNKIIYIVVLILLLSFTSVACNSEGLGDLLDQINNSTIVDGSIQSISISGLSEVEVGNSITLTATVSPTTASQKVTWSTSNSKVATVDTNGKVTGVSSGKATIKATSQQNSSVYKTFLVIVNESSVEPTSISIVGDTTIYVGNTSSYTIATTPENSNSKVTWSSSDEEIATVSYDGVVRAIKAGKFTLTATYSESLSATLEITVANKTVLPQKLSLKGYNYIYVNEVNTIEYSVLPSNAIDTVIWSSSDEEVATVDSKGRVKGIKEGEVTITATSTASLTVKASITIKICNEPILVDNEQDSLQYQIKDVVNYVRKSVFGVVNYQYSRETNALEKKSIGSGFVYKVYAILNDGTKVTDISTISDMNQINKYCYYLLTNRHVVEESEMLKIYIGEYDKYIDATLCQYDDKVDVAVVYFEFHDYIKPLTLANSESVETGDFVLAMGNPESLDYYDSTTLGIVSNPLRYVSTDTDGDNVYDWDQAYIQHDAAINPGNSGGPLFNLMGEVVGINTMKLASVDIDTMGFSVCNSSYIDLLSLLEEGIKPERALLGVSVLEVRNASNGKLYTSQTTYIEIPTGLNYGLYVNSVTSGQTADKAGVKQGDIILSIDGIDLKEGYQVRIALGKFIVGSGNTTVLEVYRNNQVINLTITF